MGIEQVNTDFRVLTEADYNIEHYDVAEMKLHHSYNPKKNYCTLEMKIPSIKYQMYDDDFNNILNSLYLPSLHGIKFNKVSNNDFYDFLRNEGDGTVDKLRKSENGKVYTYYFSNSRKLKFFTHDYSMALMVYLGYPNRNYIRRTPCAKISSRCHDCWEKLSIPVRSYLDESLEEYNATIYKYFFTGIGEKHRLLVAYTIEDEKTPGECFLPNEPDYFITDLGAIYFNSGFTTKYSFEQEIIKRKKTTDKDIYHMVSYDTEGYSGPIGLGTDGYFYARYENGGATGVKTINIAKGDAPSEILNALENGDFRSVFRFDMRNFNVRNTIHKFQYNHWVEKCTHADDGLWCAWSITEALDNAESGAPGSEVQKGMVRSQINQVASTFGWGETGDTSSSDIEYTFIAERELGINYEVVLEPLPDRIQQSML